MTELSAYERDPDLKKGVDLALEIFASCFTSDVASKDTSEESCPVLGNSSFVTVPVNPYQQIATLSSEIDPGVPDFSEPAKNEKVTIAPFEKTVRQLKKERDLERSKTLGKKYFDFKPAEMTKELIRDLKIIKSRNLLQKGVFSNVSDYKKGLPTAVQIGTVVEDKSEFYSSRVPKKMRQKTLVDELAADFEFRKKLKEKYAKIQDSKPKRLGGGKFKGKGGKRK